MVLKNAGAGMSDARCHRERLRRLVHEHAGTKAESALRWDLASGVQIRVLSAMGDTYGEANDIDLDPSTRELDENCGSIALLVRLGQFEFYTAGDQTSDDWRAFQDTEIAVVNSAAFGSNRDVDVFKVNHHGSESSNGPRFLHALDPEVAIISSRLGQHQTPKAITVQELLRNGAVVYITGDALDDYDLFPSSINTDRDDGFTSFPADSVINAASDVHVYVARDGRSYRVVTAAGSGEYSAVDSENPHSFEYAEDDYPERGAPGVSGEGLVRCKG